MGEWILEQEESGCPRNGPFPCSIARERKAEVSMCRLANFSLLGALLAFAGSMAAPAPLRRSSPVWTVGWDKPVDTLGLCRFDRDGDKLTLTVPGKEDRINAP